MVKGEKIRVCVTSPSFCQNTVLMDELKLLPIDLTINSDFKKLEGESLRKFLLAAKPHVIILGTESFQKELIRELSPTLKVVSKYGVGLDNVDENALREFGVTLGWTAGVNKRSVSELALTFMMAHSRNIFASMFKMREGRWEKNGGRLLSGRKIGIVGLGNIGFDLAQLLLPFSCEIMYHDIEDRSAWIGSLPIQKVSFSHLLKESDIVTLHVPQEANTIHMIDSEEISQMKSSALLINTARGKIVNFDEAVAAVKEGRLGGYASDVFPEEPIDVSKLSDHYNFYFTPHIGGNANEAVLAMGRSAILHLKNFLKEQGYQVS